MKKTKQEKWERELGRIINCLYVEVEASIAEDLDVRLKNLIKKERKRAYKDGLIDCELKGFNYSVNKLKEKE